MMEPSERLHHKLVCVAKRGRFSHVVAPRVWQAPDGRCITILDDADEPLPSSFYDALKTFEVAELEKLEASESEGVEQIDRSHSKGLGAATDSAAAAQGPRYQTEAGQDVFSGTTSSSSVVKRPHSASAAAQTIKGKSSKIQGKTERSIISFLKGEDISKARTQTSSKVHSKAIANASNTKELPNPGETNNGERELPSTATSELPSTVPLEETLDANPSERSWHFTARDCLIHQWNPAVRARCYTLQQHHPVQVDVKPVFRDVLGFPTIPSFDTEVILWIRVGCVRLEDNLALDQAVWLQQRTHCTISALAFVNHERLDVLEAMSELKDRLWSDHRIRLSLLGAAETSAALSCLAMWTRTRPVLAIFTSESYRPSDVKVTQAVSRAVRCPVVSFDSEHSAPLRYLKATTASLDLNTVEVFKAYYDRQHRLPRAETSSSHSASTESQSSSGNNSGLGVMKDGGVPDVILRRWSLLSPAVISGSLDQGVWRESAAKRLLGDPGVSDSLLLEHMRLGTISPLAVIQKHLNLVVDYAFDIFRNVTSNQ